MKDVDGIVIGLCLIIIGVIVENIGFYECIVINIYGIDMGLLKFIVKVVINSNEGFGV